MPANSGACLVFGKEHLPDGPGEQGPEGLDPRDLRHYPVRKRLGLLEPLRAVVVPPTERGYAPPALECSELERLKRQRPDTLHEVVLVPL